MAALLALINIFVFVAVTYVPAHPGAPGGAGLKVENVSLEAELSLAGKKTSYAVLDLGEGGLDMKARGITLKRLQFTGARLFGRTPPSGPVKLLEKKSLIGPRRESIKTNAGEDAASDPYDVKALEVHEMPSSYRLHFEDGMTLHVVPADEGLMGHIRTLTGRTRGAAGRPFRQLWHALRGKGHLEVELTMKAEDAKAFYWHMGEGTPLLVIDP